MFTRERYGTQQLDTVVLVKGGVQCTVHYTYM